jgi:putative DNA primase/helicase
MPDDHWTELSGVLSKSVDGEQSPLQIERLIKKKSTKRKKEDAKAKLTQAEIVDTAAKRALKTIAKDSRDLLRPPKASFYIYRDGHWKQLYDEAVSTSCFNELNGFLDKSTPGLKPLPYYTREALNQVSYMVGTESTALYNRKELPSCVNLINGTLWFYSDGTYKLEPHRREDFLTTRLPYIYDQNAECPSMITMLTQVFDDVRRDYSEEEMWDLIRHFWEFAGYILTPKKDIAMMMFFLGQGHNGKSKISSILSKLLDPGTLLSNDLTMHLDPSNRHGTAALEGKLLAMDDDVGENAEISDKVFKKICQSKPFNINPKNKDSRQIMLQTIVLFIANNGVKIVDTSLGFSRRTYVIEFSDISHLQSSPLPDLVELIEMPGVLNEAIKGLARLRQRGFFDVPKCAQDFKAKFLVESNSVLSFWEYCDKIESEGETIKVQDLYSGYSYYMSSGGFGKAVSRKAFAKALQRQKIAMVGEDVVGWKINIVVC